MFTFYNCLEYDNNDLGGAFENVINVLYIPNSEGVV